MYAGDTSFAHSSKNVKDIASTMNTELEICMYGYIVISLGLVEPTLGSAALFGEHVESLPVVL